MTTKIGYTAMLELFTKFIEQGYCVKTFDSEKMTILFDMVTSNEILAISKTLKVSGFDNEILMMNSISFKIRFL